MPCIFLGDRFVDCKFVGWRFIGGKFVSYSLGFVSPAGSHILSSTDHGEVSLFCLLDLSKYFDVIDHSRLLSKLHARYRHVLSFSFGISEGSHPERQPHWRPGWHSKIPSAAQQHRNFPRLSLRDPSLLRVCQRCHSVFPIRSGDSIPRRHTSFGLRQQIRNTNRRHPNENVLASLDIWFRAIGLKVNAAKIQLILGSPPNLRTPDIKVTFRDHYLLHIPEAKYLGIPLILLSAGAWKATFLQLPTAASGLSVVYHICLGTYPLQWFLWMILALVNALVLSQIRYCISVERNGTKQSLSGIQSVLNYSKVIFGRKKYDHVSDLLTRLGWLSAGQLVEYHMLTSCTRCALAVSRAAGGRSHHRGRDSRPRPGPRHASGPSVVLPRSRTELGGGGLSAGGRPCTTPYRRICCGSLRTCLPEAQLLCWPGCSDVMHVAARLSGTFEFICIWLSVIWMRVSLIPLCEATYAWMCMGACAFLLLPWDSSCETSVIRHPAW